MQHPWDVPGSNILASPRARFRMFPPALRFLLGGYLLFSKPFGYLHLPGTPLFVGELVMLIGIAEVARTRLPFWRVVTASPLLRVLLVFMGWCSLRTLVSLTAEPWSKIDTLRDSALWYYGIFALLVAYVAAYDPTFLPGLRTWFRRIIPWFLAWAPLAVVLKTKAFTAHLIVPGSDTPVLAFKPGDIAVNVVMAMTFLWLDLGPARRRATARHDALLVVLALAGLAFVTSQTRGGFLGAALAIVIVFRLMPHRRKRRLVRSTGPLLLALLILLAIVNPKVQAERRQISMLQMVTNVASILGGGNADQSGTAEWRKQLWHDTLQDTLSPRFLVAGMGFGINIYQQYRPQELDATSTQPLRNPHNSHLDVWARTGLVGVLLWVSLWAALFAYLIRVARTRGYARPRDERHLAIWIGATILGLLVNSFFDPALEGPQASIWMWCLVGVAATITRPQPR